MSIKQTCIRPTHNGPSVSPFLFLFLSLLCAHMCAHTHTYTHTLSHSHTLIHTYEYIHVKRKRKENVFHCYKPFKYFKVKFDKYSFKNSGFSHQEQSLLKRKHISPNIHLSFILLERRISPALPPFQLNPYLHKPLLLLFCIKTTASLFLLHSIPTIHSPLSFHLILLNSTL